MSMDELLQTVRAFDGVLEVVPVEGSGFPEIAWGDHFFYFAPDREARIAAALRAGGYRIPDVQNAITAVRELNHVSRTVAALDARLETIAERALALLRAGALLAEVIESA